MVSNIAIYSQNMSSGFEVNITHISGFQLNFVINAGHSDLTLAAHGEVVGVGGDERHF